MILYIVPFPLQLFRDEGAEVATPDEVAAAMRLPVALVSSAPVGRSETAPDPDALATPLSWADTVEAEAPAMDQAGRPDWANLTTPPRSTNPLATVAEAGEEIRMMDSFALWEKGEVELDCR